MHYRAEIAGNGASHVAQVEVRGNLVRQVQQQLKPLVLTLQFCLNAHSCSPPGLPSDGPIFRAGEPHADPVIPLERVYDSHLIQGAAAIGSFRSVNFNETDFPTSPAHRSRREIGQGGCSDEIAEVDR